MWIHHEDKLNTWLWPCIWTQTEEEEAAEEEEVEEEEKEDVDAWISAVRSFIYVHLNFLRLKKRLLHTDISYTRPQYL